MPKICYMETKMGAARQKVVDQANVIIAEYKASGYELTLRQLYYQFVSRDLIANTQREYKNLGETINCGRLAGMIDWNAIVDRTRNLESVGHWNDPEDIIRSCAYSFRLDKWANQPRRVEVWVEKDALVGVIEKAAREMDVAWFSCRGYTSQSELWSAGQRMAGYVSGGQEPVIVHLGDHDPSGKDMTRDITDRLQMFAGHEIEVKRIALNMDQVEQYNPPPNPAKITDSRAAGYMAEFGDESWELDALDPEVLHDLIVKTVTEVRDLNLWKAMVADENVHRENLTTCSSRWDDVAEFLRNGGE